MATELSRVMESVGKDKGIEREEIVRAVEEAVLSAAQRLFRTEGSEKELEVQVIRRGKTHTMRYLMEQDSK